MKARAPFHVLAKPAGALCNLECEYCFYLGKSRMYPGSHFRMSDELLETHIRSYIESQPQECLEVNFSWQGGEPTLLGIEFLQRAVDLQERYRRPGMKVVNTLQTNGTRLDQEWCRFLHRNRFLVGISIDGPALLHDRYRKTRSGEGTFAQVVRGLEYLIAEGVEFNVLAALQDDNANHPLEVYEGLKALGAENLQFIPIVERTGEREVSARSVRPRQFGQFLIEVFDAWRATDIGRISVQQFDTALSVVMGNPWTLCVHAPGCGRAVALEHNGDVFSCDHYVFEEYRLGNITEQSYEHLLDGDRQTAFGDAKWQTLSPRCIACSVRPFCNGGCPAHRFVPQADSDHGLSYLCEGYMMFFKHVEPYMRAIWTALEQRLPPHQYFRFLTDAKLRPRRNAPCPCGSGRKCKQCCGG